MAEQITLLSAGAVKPGLVKAIERFHHIQNSRVQLDYATAPELRRRVLAEESPDLVIAPTSSIDELARAGKIAPAKYVSLGRIGVGVLVRDGATVPIIDRVENFKQSLLDAESIVFNQASTGLYIESLFKRLCVTPEVDSKLTRYADFAAVCDHVANGHGAEIGFGATTVIIENAGHGVRYVGPLPAELQNYTTYIAASTSHAGDAARALLRFFETPAATAIFVAAGIQ